MIYSITALVEANSRQEALDSLGKTPVTFQPNAVPDEVLSFSISETSGRMSSIGFTKDRA